MPLFVVLEEGRTLDGELRTLITTEIRREASPRHVPDEIFEVAAVPHTRTGKKLEVPIKRILLGAKLEDVLSLGGRRPRLPGRVRRDQRGAGAGPGAGPGAGAVAGRARARRGSRRSALPCSAAALVPESSTSAATI